MDIPWKTIIWNQFGGAIDSLDNALRDCPDELWRARLWEYPPEPPELSQVWYVVYHTIFWIDLYLTGAEEGFTPPAPFILIEQDQSGPIPERVYTRGELKRYLDECRERCRATIEALSDEEAVRQCRFGWGELTFAELLLYTMRHVQEHASQLNMLLGQNVGAAPERFEIRARRGAHLDPSTG